MRITKLNIKKEPNSDDEVTISNEYILMKDHIKQEPPEMSSDSRCLPSSSTSKVNIKKKEIEQIISTQKLEEIIEKKLKQRQTMGESSSNTLRQLIQEEVRKAIYSQLQDRRPKKQPKQREKQNSLVVQFQANGEFWPKLTKNQRKILHKANALFTPAQRANLKRLTLEAARLKRERKLRRQQNKMLTRNSNSYQERPIKNKKAKLNKAVSKKKKIAEEKALIKREAKEMKNIQIRIDNRVKVKREPRDRSNIVIKKERL